jgi:hypothetical protein
VLTKEKHDKTGAKFKTLTLQLTNTVSTMGTSFNNSRIEQPESYTCAAM